MEHFNSFFCTVDQGKKLNRLLLGQGLELQFLDSNAGPSRLQSLPPFDGAGLVHSLVLCCIPPPHVTLHEENSVHCVYPPLPKNEERPVTT